MVMVTGTAFGQPVSEVARFLATLQLRDIPPDGLTASRSMGLYSSEFMEKDLQDVQKGLMAFGIDPVSYVESERPLAGRDMITLYGRNFIQRDIHFLIFMEKGNAGCTFYIVGFNGTLSWTSPGQTAWRVQGPTIRSAIETIRRAVIGSQKRENFLVNDFPERTSKLNRVHGERNEFMAPNLRANRVAVPKFGEAKADSTLAVYLKANFPVKYELVDPLAEDKDLLDKGFVYVLRYLHAPGSLAKAMLGYDMTKSESAFVSESYNNGVVQLKTIPANQLIYKFYIRHLDYTDYYLGLKWDADITWQEALKNHLDGYRAARQIY